MATEYGFVYVLANESMPGIYKIGFTLNHPKARMDQLSSATACPTPFDMVACFGVANPRDVEATMHARLSKFRVNAAREFFRVAPNILRSMVMVFADETDDLVNICGLNEECEYHYDSILRWEESRKIDYFFEQCADPIEWPVESVEIPF